MEKIKDQKEFTLRQKILLYSYKGKQYFNNWWYFIRQKVNKYVDSVYFYFIVFIIFVFILHKVLIYFNLNIPEDNLYSFAFATAGIIGASIAIIFSFSTFILQSTADLFSTQYLKKFIKDTKEVIFFWLLVFLTVTSFFIPIFFKKYSIEILIIYLFSAFYLIYDLYKGSRKRIDPETTLVKIKDDSIKRLEKIKKELFKHAQIQNKIFKYDGVNKRFSLDVQYKTNPNWNLVVLENIKYLFEIGLRLLAKNEINSFNLTIAYINHIYLKHLYLRNGYFIRMPASFWGTYLFNDEGFTTGVLEYLQSIGDRLIQEKRKENIYFLLKIYGNILKYSINIEYADKNPTAHKENPLLSLILAYYIEFIEKLLFSKENDWIWESIKSVSNVSNSILQKTDNYSVYTQINSTINKIAASCLAENKEVFLRELVNVYFNQIKIAWSKYEHNDIFWNDLFKELKEKILFLSTTSDLTLSISELFINFHTWQAEVINHIIKENKTGDDLDRFVKLLNRWSGFLLDFARDIGLENKQIGLSIIQSVDNNIRVIYGIKIKFKNVDLEKIYKSQFHTLSWYFQGKDKVEKSFLFNMEHVLEILLREIRDNLKERFFDTKPLIDLYIRLIETHFKKVELGHGYNHPRVIDKLVYLGLLLNKYKKVDEENNIIAKIDALNKEYLEYNKEFFKLKKKEKNLMGPNEFQLCEEIYNLGEDLFSHNSPLMGLKYILKDEITKEVWNDFKDKITYCKDIEYKTERMF